MGDFGGGIEGLGSGVEGCREELGRGSSWVGGFRF